MTNDYARHMENVRLKDHIFQWAQRLFLLSVTAVTLYPVLWNILSSFKSNPEFISSPYSLPTSIETDNYYRAFQAADIGTNFLNSVIAVVVLLVVVTVCVIPCSYILARYRFFGSRLILGFFMAAIFIKATYIMTPLFLQMNSLGLTNKVIPYAVLYAVTQFPFSIFLMTGFMRTIPRAYEEAAMIDGCGNFRILTQIIAPMARPGIMTVCMLSAMAVWNDYPIALVMLTDASKMTLSIGIASLYIQQGYYADWVALFAALVIVLVPTVAAFAVGQRYLIQGISAGGVKG
ncbi:MAG: carbohydrate ABC transporter permease [Oscillospiraceae bacterium]|nr:carbohydrate ABC transporter permease [Oscillospiraceae bacterium]